MFFALASGGKDIASKESFDSHHPADTVLEKVFLFGFITAGKFAMTIGGFGMGSWMTLFITGKILAPYWNTLNDNQF